MAFVEAAADPLRAAADATSLLLRTLGSAESAASPSRARGALLDGSVKGSKEVVEQARLVMKERGDIQKLYQEDGVKVAAAAAANGKNNQQGRRPALDRKRARFTLKAPPSNTVQNVDFSQLLNIEDPEEYFSTLEQLEKADREIKKLRGEVPTKTADSHRAIEPPTKRPGMSRRKSVHSYKFCAGAATPDVTEAPASQIGTITEPLFTQDDMPASVPERTVLPVPSSSSQCDIPDVSVRKDLFAEKDKGATWDYLMSEFKILDEYEEENLLREKLQLKEISIGKVCLPDLFNVPGDRPVSSTTVRKSPTSGHTPERPVSGSHHTRISQWEKHFFGGDILKDKADLSEDDESDGSPETVLGKQSLVHSSYDAVGLMAGEASTARETTSPSIKSPDLAREPEPNISNGISTDEREPGNSSFGAYRDSEVAKEKDASSRHNVSLEEDDVPMDHPVIEKPNHETEVSSHHLEGDSTEVLGSTPGRNASALHDEDDNFEHQGVVGRNGLLQDKPIHPPEIPPEDIDPHNQSHIHDGNVEKRAVDISNELSLGKDGKQKAVRKGKNTKQPSKRGKRAADEASHPLEIPPANFDPETQPCMQDINVKELVGRNVLLQDKPIHTSEIPTEDIDPQNQSHMHDGNFEKPGVDISNEHSLRKDSKQNTVRNGKTKKQPSKRGKRAADEVRHPLVPLANFDPETQLRMQDTNIEQQTVGTSDPRSPNKGKGRKEAQRRNKRQELNGRKSLAAFGLSWQSGVRRSTRIRSRPLQDWRGERFLYGRIHDTMATVIGIKSYSPSQDGKAAMRVKSFVSEQYSDIVAQVSRY